MKKKYTVAYYERVINEIVVEASNEEDAYEAAESAWCEDFDLFNETERTVENVEIVSVIDIEKSDKRSIALDSHILDLFSQAVEKEGKDPAEILKELMKSRLEQTGSVCYELCPECENEVVLENGFAVQTCPECGKPILPCSICDGCRTPCPLEKYKTE